MSIARTHKLKCAVIPALFGAVIATSANASDSKYFNGSFCRAVFPFGADFTQVLLEYNGNGSVANKGLSNPVDVGCPIVRDILPHDAGWDSLEIGYFDKHPGDAISCTAWAGNMADGSLFFSQPGFSSDNNGALWKKDGMTFGPNGGGFVDGYYWILCTLPLAPDTASRSGIAYYRIQES